LQGNSPVSAEKLLLSHPEALTCGSVVSFTRAPLSKKVYTISVNRASQKATLIVLREFRFCLKEELCESGDLMATNNTMNLRFIGVIPQSDFLEYGFRIEDKDREPRFIVIMIESDFFKKYALMFQEAPDLCYQKLLADLKNETAELPVNPRLSITATDIAYYRELHPVGKSSRLRYRNLPPQPVLVP
jgi:hypothetical protein